MDKREKTERERQEDIALHKVLYWMGGAVILVVLLRLVQSYYIDLKGGALMAWRLGQAIPWVCLVGVLLTVGAFVWALRSKKAGNTAIFPWALSGLLLGFTVCAVGVWWKAGIGIALLTYSVIGIGILAMLYYLFQHDFVLVGAMCGLGLMGLWLFFHEGATTRYYIALAGILVLLAAMVVFARYLQQHGGVLTVKGRKLELLPKSASYALIYVTCGLMAVVLVAALVLSGAISYMAFYAVPVAWGLVTAVYYTVKLM